MGLLRFHPPRLTPGQIEQLFLVTEHRFDRPPPDLAGPGLTWCTLALIRDQIQIGPLRLIDPHPRQPHMPDPWTVDIRTRHDHPQPAGRPIVQLAFQCINPLPLAMAYDDVWLIGGGRGIGYGERLVARAVSTRPIIHRLGRH